MEAFTIFQQIDNGAVHYKDHSDSLPGIKWMKHPSFHGIHLKHMIRGKDTGHIFSSHLVKIGPGCCLEMHCHENHLELHEVIEGDGFCQLIENRFDYRPGKMAVIPEKESHLVQAGGNGLILLAKFFPAML
ncbi:MAG: ectoine synthase [Proteobacteria bacterium]|nr:ectoine synthase [Pseudomonadota bacterium]